MNTPAISISPAFRDVPREAQAVFRTVVEAMAHPGRIFPLIAGFAPPRPLTLGAAAIMLTLADFETPVWLDRVLSENPAVREFLRFHTGARFAADPVDASFALIGDPAGAPPLDVFAQGTAEYPDRSATVIFQVETLSPDGWQLEGPGIRKRGQFSAAPLRTDFLAQLTENRKRFPLGVDLIFAASDAIAAVPRSTRLVGAF